MSERKWTPGPWTTGDVTLPCVEICTIEGEFEEIPVWAPYSVGGVDSPGWLEPARNAHLIAAAPELYEALEFMRACMEHGCAPSGKELAIKNARTALAKARGEV